MQWKALFVGDIMMKQLPKAGFLSPGFSVIMQEHAFRSCNFEAPLQGKGQPIKKAGPHVNQHPEAANYVEREGFNLVTLANNHIYDFGADALAATISSFSKVTTVGAGNSFDEAYALKKLSIHGITVGFLSFCEAEFGALTVNSINKAGYAWINHPGVNSLIIESRKSVDVLIIQTHAGVEQIDIPLPEWRERYKELIRLGADAVIGSHPHVPQGWEIYNDRPIFYSLGNFYFDMASDHPLWNTGLAVSLAFDDAKFTGFTVIPIKKSAGKIELNEDKFFAQHLDNINKQLQEPVYSKTVNDTVSSLWEKYYRSYYDMSLQGIHARVPLTKAFKTFVKRLFFKNKIELNSALLLHNIRIESHRWVVERALAMQNSI
jgi:poly-gamma-glutamate capsule biosynthesis protein CapA/YwtB (metallophosphatase superfamily)